VKKVVEKVIKMCKYNDINPIKMCKEVFRYEKNCNRIFGKVEK
jgi:hypothetical protein